MNVAQLMKNTWRGKLACAMFKTHGILNSNVTRLISEVVIFYEFDFTGVYG